MLWAEKTCVQHTSDFTPLPPTHLALLVLHLDAVLICPELAALLERQEGRIRVGDLSGPPASINILGHVHFLPVANVLSGPAPLGHEQIHLQELVRSGSLNDLWATSTWM